jgi:asparagine synthase (glutamine-hydrolysing)
MLRAALPYISTWLALPTTQNLFFLRLLLDRAAGDGIRVLLDGEGGDALFWYSVSVLAHRLHRGRLLSAWSLAGRFPEYGVPTTWRTRVDKLRQWGRQRDFTPAPEPWLSVSPQLLEAEPGEPLCEAGPSWWREVVEGILGAGSRMVHDITRRGCALSGIEPRHPLLDVDLVEEVLTFPPDLAFDRRHNRPVLREAVAGYVTDEVRLRPYKSNFDAVIAAGMDADLPVLRALLLDPSARVAAYTDRRAVGELLGLRPSGQAERRERGNALWRLATLECLLRVQGGDEVLPASLLSSIRTPQYSFSRL